MHAARSGDQQRGRLAIRARDSNPGRLSRSSMHCRGVRWKGDPRSPPHAWESIHDQAQRKRPFFGFAYAVRSWPIPLVSRRAKFVSDISRDYCRERRRRNHGVAPSPIPSARSAIPSGIRTHARRQENSREFPRACSRNRDERSQLTLRMKARIKSVHLWPPLPLLQGERIEVWGSTGREFKPQTLTLPSPLRRERRDIEARNASKKA